jgi:hypothetical protein
MKYADYQCVNCQRVRTIHVPNLEIFPESVPCVVCQGDSLRKYTPLFPIVHQQKCGNSKNGYKSNPVKITKT